MKKCILIHCILYFSFYQSYAQPGSLDITFNIGGKVTTGIGSTNDEGRAVAIQSDGKIVVAGFANRGGFNYDFVAVRYNTNGTLDNTFGNGGKVVTDFTGGDDRCTAVGIQSDGKIVITGTCRNGSIPHFALIRYTTNGMLDSSFDSDGKVVTDFGGTGDKANAIAFQSDGKIVVAGSSSDTLHSDFAIARYNADGSLDSLFDADGMVTTDFGNTYDFGYSLAIQSDDKIVVTGASTNSNGSDFAMARYNSNGALDTNFGTIGKVITDLGSTYDESYSVALQSDGKIVSAGLGYGGVNDDFALVRYNSDGSLDTGFDSDGKVFTPIGSSDDFCRSVAIQGDGKIIASGFSYNGSSSDFALVRYNNDGSLETAFGTGGKQTTDFGNNNDDGYSVAIQSDGKIVMAGASLLSNYDFAVARYNNNNTCTPVNFSQSKTICKGDSVTLGGSIYKANGIYKDTLTSSNGCDSIITTNLTVNLTYSDTVSITINNGDSLIIGNHTYKSPGIFTDTLLTFKGCDSIIRTNLTVQTGTGIEGVNNAQPKIEIYPNPASSKITITVSGLRNEEVQLSIINMIGEQIYLSLIEKVNGNYSKEISLQDMNEGIYFGQIKTSDSILTKKIIVNR